MRIWTEFFWLRIVCSIDRSSCHRSLYALNCVWSLSNSHAVGRKEARSDKRFMLYILCLIFRYVRSSSI